MDEKLRLYSLNYFFCHFLPRFQKLKNRLKMDEKLRLYSLNYFFCHFLPLSKIEKSAKNGRKVKAIALLFCYFLPIFQFLKKRQKMAKT